MTDLLVEARVAPREQFTTVYSGMDVAPFLRANEHREATRTRLAFAPEQIVVGKIARLFHLKGHAYLIAAATQIVSACPQVQFLFVGDGILRDSLREQIAAAGLHNHFRFTGLVAPDEIPALIGAMDVVVHVSLREGLARALPQALIAGTQRSPAAATLACFSFLASPETSRTRVRRSSSPVEAWSRMRMRKSGT